MKIKTLVIGGSGYIGLNLVPALVESGREVLVLDYDKKNLDVVGVEYVLGDFSNKDLLDKLTDGCMEIVHLAYASVPNTSFENPYQDLTENLAPTLHLFSIAARKKIKLIYISSGGTVYGPSIKLPISEDFPTNPISPYGITKLTLEKYAYFYSKNYGLEFVCLRPANPYGQGQRPYAGQGFVSTAIASILEKKPVIIYGVSGSVRDYIHISDLVNGILCVIERGRVGETYNIGTGIGHSNVDILRKVHGLIHKGNLKLHFECLPARTFDVDANILDCSRLNLHTGWKSQVNIDDGLKQTVAWVESFLNFIKK
jgi:UDP-glucose 4-epimerase